MVREDQRQHKLLTKHGLMIKMGGKCTNCDVNDFDVLQFDHINNDGYKDKIVSNDGKIRRKYRNVYHLNLLFKTNEKLFRETYQLLCANCNLKKEIIFRALVYKNKKGMKT